MDFDYLIIGIVSNDPHPRGKFLDYKFNKSFYQRKNFSLQDKINGLNIDLINNNDYVFLKYFDSILLGIMNNFSEGQGSVSMPPIVTHGYYNWEKRLYDKDVLNLWERIIIDFEKKVVKHNHTYLLTPTDNSIQSKYIYDVIDKLFNKINLNYVNTMPLIDQKFDYKLRKRKDWANLADGHPGEIQHQIYANEVVRLLKKEGITK